MTDPFDHLLDALANEVLDAADLSSAGWSEAVLEVHASPNGTAWGVRLQAVQEDGRRTELPVGTRLEAEIRSVWNAPRFVLEGGSPFGLVLRVGRNGICDAEFERRPDPAAAEKFWSGRPTLVRRNAFGDLLQKRLRERRSSE